MVNGPVSLDGGVVLVSGAGRGMGSAAARRIAECGATVALTSRTREQVNAAAAEIRAAGGSAYAFVADAADLDAHNALLDAVEGTCGALTGLVNVAGISPYLVRAETLTPDQFDEIMRVNVRGTYFFTQAVARRWIERSVGGAVVTISSVGARYGLPRLTAYAMSRAAVEGMTRSLASEWSAALDPPIRVNGVAPGFIRTQFTWAMPPWYVVRTEQHTAMKRWGEDDEVATAVVFLLSNAASYITGQILDVSGGYGIWSLDPLRKT